MVNKDLRAERVALLIGTMIGQMSELLNSIKNNKIDIEMTYRSLFDLHQMAALQLHEVYYKGNKPDDNK